MMKNRLFVACIQFAVGTLFIVSGLAKAADADRFGTILMSYGAEWLYFAAPFVIFAELLIGLALMFGLRPRHTALAGLAAVAVFTAVYTYGLIFRGVTDCGCFGRLAPLNASPALLYVRNMLLAAALLLVAMQKDRSVTTASVLSVLPVSLVLMTAGAFLCGNTFSRVSVRTMSKARFKPVALSQHPLNEFVDTDKDSTYMVTAFSYTCPHCINSIGNIEQYEPFGIVDAVIGLSIDNREAETVFREKFRPSFRILNYPTDKLNRLSYEFPVSYIIRNDSIVGIIPGEVPSAYFFEPL